MFGGRFRIAALMIWHLFITNHLLNRPLPITTLISVQQLLPTYHLCITYTGQHMIQSYLCVTLSGVIGRPLEVSGPEEFVPTPSLSYIFLNYLTLLTLHITITKRTNIAIYVQFSKLHTGQ